MQYFLYVFATCYEVLVYRPLVLLKKFLYREKREFKTSSSSWARFVLCTTVVPTCMSKELSLETEARFLLCMQAGVFQLVTF